MTWRVSDTDLESLGQAAAQIPGVTGFKVAHGDLGLTAEAGQIVAVLRALREEHGFQQLIDLAGVDYPTRARRFEVVYHLLSYTRNLRIRINIQTEEAAPVPSVIAVYPNADWYEREAFDMYGIAFTGHPDLRRILTDYGFEGYPLRKDFPMSGHVEVRYDPDLGRVVYEPIKMTEWRNWDFLSPWEGADYARPGEGYPYGLPGDEKAEKPK